MESSHKSFGFTFIFWSLFGIVLGVIIGLGTGEIVLPLLIGALFGGGIGLMIIRHAKRKHFI